MTACSWWTRITCRPVHVRTLRSVRTVTDKPVKYLVNTHWHGDHTHGNGVYRAKFPNLTIVGARANRVFIA